MGNSPGKNSIHQILESLPGDTVLATLSGTVLARKGNCSGNDYLAWSYVSLFSGMGKACRLYWKVPGGYDPILTTGPLELLLKDLVVSGPGYWFKRMLTEPADAFNFEDLPPDTGVGMPLRLAAIRIGSPSVDEACEAMQALLPDLKYCVLEPGVVILMLPMDRETAHEWAESIMALLSEELMLDPLIIYGEGVTDFKLLHTHATVLEKTCKALYPKGRRGFQTLMGNLPELVVGKIIENPLPLILDLGRVIEPMLKDPDLCQTAEVFVQRNLSITETAQDLFLHRNTLVYRLMKIEKLTGLDLKRLDHAMAFTLLKAARE